MSDQDAALLQDLAEQGVHVVHVPEDGDRPAYSYSIGLVHHWRHPEVIVFGLPREVMHALLELIADEIDGGKRLVAGERHDDYLTGYPIRVVAVPRRHVAAWLPKACWAYENDEFPVLQVCWPDRRGRWPWEAGVHTSVGELQPVLERLPLENATGG